MKVILKTAVVFLVLVWLGSVANAAIPPLPQYDFYILGNPVTGWVIGENSLDTSFNWNNPVFSSRVGGYNGENVTRWWLNVLVVGGTFNPTTTAIPWQNWVGMSEAYVRPGDGETPTNPIDFMYMNNSVDPITNGWNYYFTGEVKPQPWGLAWNIGTLLQGSGQLADLQVQTYCAPHFPEPASVLVFITGLLGLGTYVKRTKH
jgi:hypothetical protein